MASGYKDTADEADLPINLLDQGDWRADIFNYLKDPARGTPKKIRYRAMKYVLIGDVLFYGTLEGVLLKCLGPIESNRLLHEVHDGTCGTHQSAHKMKWLISARDIIVLICWKIASSIIKDARPVRSLEGYK
jgi:hypothetical protein